MQMAPGVIKNAGKQKELLGCRTPHLRTVQGKRKVSFFVAVVCFHPPPLGKFTVDLGSQAGVGGWR